MFLDFGCQNFGCQYSDPHCAHLQTGRMIDASPSTARLGLGRTDIELCLITREMGTVFIIGLFKQGQSVMISGRTAAMRSSVTWFVVLLGSFEAHIERRVTFRVSFRTSGQNFARSYPFEFSKFGFLFCWRW